MKKCILFILLCICFLFNVYSYAEQIVFEGTPIVRVSSSVEESRSEPLNEKEQAEYKLVITIHLFL